MLRGCSCLRRHLKLANLTLRKASVVAARAALLRLWWLGLLMKLRRLGRDMVQTCRLSVRSIEVDASGRGWDFALGLEQSRLKVDDVVAQLVVFGLQGLVQIA